jgi:hypothetical protein
VLALLKTDVNSSVGLPEDLHNGLETIKQIFIPYKAIMFNNDFQGIIMRTLDLRTLFIHLDPADLFAMDRGPARLDVIRYPEDQKGYAAQAPLCYFAAKNAKTGCPSLPIPETASTMSFAPRGCWMMPRSNKSKEDLGGSLPLRKM